MWIQIAIIVVSLIVSYFLTPKPKAPIPATIYDFDIPVAEDGKAIPVIFGTVWITGFNVLWYGDLKSIPVKKKGSK